MKSKSQLVSPEKVIQPAGGGRGNWYLDIPAKGTCEKCMEEEPCRTCQGKKEETASRHDKG